ncbi:MAG: hypothetical protein C0505_01635 [Leptothrix sp. (in: Bacteria)]|nr:hypothetical protein [Leptothrix sp. (in: b-proteobacteria)]
MAAGLLASCGGGGGGGETPPAGNQATVALAGTAAKGLMANADVAVYPVNPDGTVGSTALATGTTQADGRYSLSFAATQGQPYVVRVTAKAGTTHLDEVTGAAQALPTGFAMRSMLVPAGTGALTVNATITPFSELAVAAAAKASGGITAANLVQAQSTVKQLLGFDPTLVAVKPTTTAAASTDEHKLAVLLTAVSQLAQTGALGCDSGSAGDKAKCVVEMMGSAADINSLKLSVGSGAAARDVSAALTGALTDVLANPALAGVVPSAALATVMANLGCTSSCAAGSTGGAGTVATAIAGSRLLFNEIKSDWSAMFANGAAGGLSGGALRREATAFEAAMAGVQPPVEMLAKDLGALLMGVDLYNDYQAGRTTASGRGRAFDMVANDGSGDFSGTSAAGCSLYTDTTTTVLATTPAEARVIGCSARYFVSRSYPAPGTTETTEWRHGFTIVPQTDGSFDYLTRARRRVTTCTPTGGCSFTVNEALQVDSSGAPLPAFAGKLTPVLSAAFGSIRSFTLVGELPAAFKSNGRTLVNLKHAANLSGTVTTATDGGITSVLGGSLVAYKADGSVEGKLTVKTGSFKQVAVSGGGHEPSEADLDLVWNAGGSEFEGRLALTDSALDASRTLRTPTKLVLSGALRNIGGGVSTEFLRGAFNLGVTGLANYNDTLPPSASNTFTVNMSFVGAVSATGRPTLEFSFGTSGSAFDTLNGATPTATLQYRTLVGGQPRLVVTLTAQETAGVMAYKLSEATANVSMSWTGERPARVDLMHANTTKIGTLDTGTGLMTFSDGSFMSLDIGL